MGTNPYSLGVIGFFCVALLMVVLAFIYFRQKRSIIRQLKEANALLQEEILMRHYVERELVKNTDELSSSNDELEQFAYVASHDLQEPLRMISSYTQLILMRYRDRFDEDGNEFMNYIIEGAQRMQKLINDLLAYSRVGRLDKEFENIDCSQVVKEALDNLQVRIEESNAAVTHDDMPLVIGNHTQLVRLIQNIVSNAMKFHCKNRDLRIHIGAAETEDRWEISIADNGIGIAPDHRGRVFDIFQRLHTRDEYEGTGIGLAVCKKIVETHRGKIQIRDGIEGSGTCFYFTLPSIQSQKEAA